MKSLLALIGKFTMTRLVIALTLGLVATSQAFAAGGGVAEYSALMGDGQMLGSV